VTTTTTETRQSLPSGTWQLDPVHSTIGFEIAYLGGTFRGQFRGVAATLESKDGRTVLDGVARVEDVDVKDDNLTAHLQSPDFFDAERHPELRFHSEEISVEDGDVTARGDITIKGVSQPVELRGTARGPITDPYGKERFGLTVSTTIDRTSFGIEWNAPLPTGEPALAKDVHLAADLYFVEA
jgi:polyisoprenoid-binding protein YceI